VTGPNQVQIAITTSHEVAKARALSAAVACLPGIVDDWRPGYPRQSLGGGGSRGTVSRPTENAAIADEHDPSRAAADLLRRILSTMTLTDGLWAEYVALATVVAAMSQAEKESLQKRQNAVELCAMCGLPAPEVHRVDGKPYHANTCYFVLWRANRVQTGLDLRGCLQWGLPGRTLRLVSRIVCLGCP